VLFNFNRCGMIVVDNTNEDAVFEAAMEAGADDVEPVAPEEDGQPSTSYKVRGWLPDSAALQCRELLLDWNSRSERGPGPWIEQKQGGRATGRRVRPRLPHHVISGPSLTSTSYTWAIRDPTSPCGCWCTYGPRDRQAAGPSPGMAYSLPHLNLRY
jgi:hypothetical protein